MALPVTHDNFNNWNNSTPEFVQASVSLVDRYYIQEKRPPSVLVIGYDAVLVNLLSLCYTTRIIVCDPNAPALHASHVSFLRQHSLRLTSGVKFDVVILNVFNSHTINRWAPVYIMRDLIRRGIVVQTQYILPIKSAMSIRLYEHPTISDTATTKIIWQEAPLTNTDLILAAGPRIDVLYEQYDTPAQSWPSCIEVGSSNNIGTTLAVLEWSVELLPNVFMSYLAHRAGGDVSHAQRLLSNRSSFFVWPFKTKTVFKNAPKLTGGIKLTPCSENNSTEQSLSIVKMDASIERWFGAIVTIEVVKTPGV